MSSRFRAEVKTSGWGVNTGRLTGENYGDMDASLPHWVASSGFPVAVPQR